MNTYLQDFRYGFRVLSKNPGFTAVAVLTLALGIGANSAIFSVVNAVVLKPLPYPEADRLVHLWSQFPSLNFWEFPVSPPEYFEFKDRNEFFVQEGAYANGGASLTGNGEPIRLTVTYATYDMLPTLRIEPHLGRWFNQQEDFPGGDSVVVISYGLWQQRFAGDPEIVGKSVQIDGTSTSVIGVMPEGFGFPDPAVQAWQPLGLDPAQVGHRWGNHFLRIVGRLEPGITTEQARARMATMLQHWGEEAQGQHRPHPQRHPFILVDLHEQVVGDVRPSMLLLSGAVAFVLLIACVNVANLLLARAEARQKEIAIRTVLGAERWRLIRQLLSESLLLALAGGAGGLALGHLGVKLLLRVNPDSVPRMGEIGLDGTVLVATLIISLLTGLLFGFMPALSLVRSDMNQPLKDGGRGTSASRGRQSFRRLLVTSEVALAVVLVVCSGLMIRSFWHLQSAETGFQAENLLTMRTYFPRSSYPEDQQVINLVRELRSGLESLPGVESVGMVSSLPLRSNLNANDFIIEGWVSGPDRPPVNVDYQQAMGPGYLEVMEIPVIQGRGFTREDREERHSVVLVSQSFVDRFWPDENPLGKRVRAGSSRPWMEVIGVVGDVRQESMNTPFKPHMYTPLEQTSQSMGFAYRRVDIVLKAAEPLSLSSLARAEIWKADPNLPVARMETMERVVGASLSEPRFTALLLMVFGFTALALAAVGIYGVMSYTVTQRTQEIGVRMALGAKGGDVLGMVVRQGMVQTALGLALGISVSLGLAVLLRSFLEEMLHGVSNTDPLTYAAVTITLALTAFAACYAPARRATRVNPIRALHYE